MPDIGGKKLEGFIVDFLLSKTGQKDHLAITHGVWAGPAMPLTFFVIWPHPCPAKVQFCVISGVFLINVILFPHFEQNSCYSRPCHECFVTSYGSIYRIPLGLFTGNWNTSKYFIHMYQQDISLLVFYLFEELMCLIFSPFLDFFKLGLQLFLPLCTHHWPSCLCWLASDHTAVDSS